MANTLQKNQEILLSITKIGINGEGIGYYKRLAVFVDGALPQENVVVRITEVHDQYSKGVLVKVKGDESPYRVKPLCKYYGKCGGWNLQHCEYQYQLKLKRDLVIEAFQRYYQKDLNIK